MSKPHQILVIDDEQISRKIIARLFDKNGFKTASAASGKKNIDNQSTASVFLSDDDAGLDQNAIDDILKQFNPDN